MHMRKRLEQLLEVNPFTPLASAVYEILLDDIIRFELLPESKLVTASLAEEMNVSRTPVKEALRQLADEGLVVSIPNRGFFVAPFNTAEYLNYFTLRIELEAMAIRVAAQEITKEELHQLRAYLLELQEVIKTVNHEKLIAAEWNYHSYIVKCSHNPYLIAAHQRLFDSFRRYNIYTVHDMPLHKTYADHHDFIYRAIRLRDADCCEAAIRAHLSRYPATYERDYLNVKQLYAEKARQRNAEGGVKA